MTPRQALYREYLKSDHWKKLRIQAVRRDGSKCTKCPCRVNLQVHHIRYRDRFEDSKLEDLVTLCEPCHTQAHGLKSKTATVIVNGGRFDPKKFPQIKKNWKKLARMKRLTKKEAKIRAKYARTIKRGKWYS